MSHSQLVEILERASETPHGIAVQSPDLTSARRLRRTLYYVRDRARRTSDKDFSDLSIIVKQNTEAGEDAELWIVRRSTIPALQTTHQIDNFRPLERDELPTQIKARGRFLSSFNPPTFPNAYKKRNAAE